MKRVSLSPNSPRQAKLDAFGDAIWAQLKTATPAQIDTYLTNNVANLAQARVVLRILILAMRYLAQKEMG
jgi:hypothetical protein